MKNIKLWFILLILLQLGDVVTTLVGGIEQEMNPFALWLWGNLGFEYLLMVKGLGVGFFVVAWKSYDFIPIAWLKILFRILLVMVTSIPMTAVVIWNLWSLLYRWY